MVTMHLSDCWYSIHAGCIGVSFSRSFSFLGETVPALPVFVQKVCMPATGLRPRGTRRVLVLSRTSASPYASMNSVGVPIHLFSRLNIRAFMPPINTSPVFSRKPMHEFGARMGDLPFPVRLFHPLLSAGIPVSLIARSERKRATKQSPPFGLRNNRKSLENASLSKVRH